jgi:hypothetical protein
MTQIKVGRLDTCIDSRRRVEESSITGRCEASSFLSTVVSSSCSSSSSSCWLLGSVPLLLRQCGRGGDGHGRPGGSGEKKAMLGVDGWMERRRGGNSRIQGKQEIRAR